MSSSKLALNNYLRQRQPGNTGYPTMGPSNTSFDNSRSSALARNSALRSSIAQRQRQSNNMGGVHPRDESLYGHNPGSMASGPNFTQSMNSQGNLDPRMQRYIAHF